MKKKFILLNTGHVLTWSFRTWCGNPQGGLWYLLRGVDERAAPQDPRGHRHTGFLFRVGVWNMPGVNFIDILRA
jgi:hypothetical protein